MSGEDELAALHAASCPRCSEELDAMAELLALARKLPTRPPAAGRRAELAAEVLALAELSPARSPRPRALVRGVAIGSIVAVAAAVALVLARANHRGDGGATPLSIEITEEAAVPVRAVAHLSAPPASPPGAIVAAAGTQFQRSGEIVELADGSLAIDTRDRAAIAVVARHSRVAIASARAEVTARRGAIESIRVFAGTVQLDQPGSRRVVISAGNTWTAPAPSAPDRDARDDSARAFRDGWLALQAGRDADAIAAFDRSTDSEIAEDAAYWAAIATERTGARADAGRRLRDFIARFPRSPRIGAARAALERVTP